MVCSSCGYVLQPNATSCINMSCADYQRPFTAAERDAARPRPPVPNAPMRPLHGLANATVACVAVTALSSAIAIPLGHLGDPSATTATTWSVVDLLILGITLIGMACFVAWLFQARRNLDALPAANPFWPMSWTIGVWFIPAGNAFMPALVVADIAKQTVADRADPRRRRLVWLANWWWISCLITGYFLYVLADRRVSVAPDIQYDPSSAALYPATTSVVHPPSPGLIFIAVTCVVASAAICIVFVRQLTALQQLRFQPETVAV